MICDTVTVYPPSVVGQPTVPLCIPAAGFGSIFNVLVRAEEILLFLEHPQKFLPPGSGMIAGSCHVPSFDIRSFSCCSGQDCYMLHQFRCRNHSDSAIFFHPLMFSH